MSFLRLELDQVRSFSMKTAAPALIDELNLKKYHCHDDHSVNCLYCKKGKRGITYFTLKDFCINDKYQDSGLSLSNGDMLMTLGWMHRVRTASCHHLFEIPSSRSFGFEFGLKNEPKIDEMFISSCEYHTNNFYLVDLQPKVIYLITEIIIDSSERKNFLRDYQKNVLVCDGIVGKELMHGSLLPVSLGSERIAIHPLTQQLLIME